MIDDAGSGHPSAVVHVDVRVDEPADEGTGEPRDLTPRQREERLRVLVAGHFDFIWRSLRRFGLSHSDADDAAQRVFVVASRKLLHIDPGKERSFLFSTAYRVAREVRRTQARRPESSISPSEDFEDPAPNPEEFADRRRARALLEQVLSEMPMEARSIFVLFELEELTVPQIASMLDLPLGTVASRLRRARELFRSAAARLRARSAFRGGV